MIARAQRTRMTNVPWRGLRGLGGDPTIQTAVGPCSPTNCPVGPNGGAGYGGNPDSYNYGAWLQAGMDSGVNAELTAVQSVGITANCMSEFDYFTAHGGSTNCSPLDTACINANQAAVNAFSALQAANGGCVPPTSGPLYRPTIPIAGAPTPVSSRWSPVLSFETANPRTPSVGDPWTISVSGAPANTAVMVTGGQGGANSTTAIGTTDGAGNFSVSGTFTGDQVGQWAENWVVAGVPVAGGNFSFTVIPTTSVAKAAAAASAPPPAATTGTPASSSSTSSVASNAVSLSGVPSWVWLAGGAAVLLLFMMGGKH